MRRSPSAKGQARHTDLGSCIRRLEAEHPFWGNRRVWAYLRYIEQQLIPQKRVYRLMKLHDRLVAPNLWLKGRWEAYRRNPKPRALNRWWGNDRTNVCIDGFGRVYVVVVLDW